MHVLVRFVTGAIAIFNSFTKPVFPSGCFSAFCIYLYSILKGFSRSSRIDKMADVLAFSGVFNTAITAFTFVVVMAGYYFMQVAIVMHGCSELDSVAMASSLSEGNNHAASSIRLAIEVSIYPSWFHDATIYIIICGFISLTVAGETTPFLPQSVERYPTPEGQRKEVMPVGEQGVLGVKRLISRLMLLDSIK